MKKISLGVIAFLIFISSSDVFAKLSNKDVLDTVIERYQSVASTWAATMTGYASYLFWGLAVISMVVTFGFMALKTADPMEFLAEFFKFSLNTGFFWWLLVNGPVFAISIINSLRKAAGTAANVPGLGPSGIVDIGFNIFFTVIDKSSISSPIDSAIGIVLGLVILICLTLIATNMLLLLISGWLLAYGGIFFLGFGGSRWTSDMAISYYKTALGLGASVMGMTLIVGVGQALINEFYSAMSKGLNLKEMAVMVVISLAMFKLTETIPGMLSGMVGSDAGSKAGGVGLGSVLGAAAIAGGAIATGGAMAMAGATNLAGGASALKAAFAAAQDNMANGTGMFSGGEGSGGGASSLAQAMGSAQGGSSGGLSDIDSGGGSTDSNGAGGGSAGGGAAPGDAGASGAGASGAGASGARAAGGAPGAGAGASGGGSPGAGAPGSRAAGGTPGAGAGSAGGGGSPGAGAPGSRAAGGAPSAGAGSAGGGGSPGAGAPGSRAAGGASGAGAGSAGGGGADSAGGGAGGSSDAGSASAGADSTGGGATGSGAIGGAPGGMESSGETSDIGTQGAANPGPWPFPTAASIQASQVSSSVADAAGTADGAGTTDAASTADGTGTTDAASTSSAESTAASSENPSSGVDQTAPQSPEAQGKPSLLRTGGLFVADMGANIAREVGKMATDKAKERLASAKDAISNTVGGKIAAAIRERQTLAAKTNDTETSEDSLSQGDSPDAQEEIQAFVNKKA